MSEKVLKNPLPDYTKGEEAFNFVTHVIGGAFGIVALVLCVIFSAVFSDAWAVVGSAIYGTSMVMLYSVSSVYHGLRPNNGKRVMRIIDHCTIYLLIAGTYTPILLTAIRRVSPLTAWILFGVVWGLGALAITLTAIDMKKYSVFSMICYIAMGWSIIFAVKAALKAIPFAGFMWLLAGGISYTIGAVMYGIGKKVRYMHGVFHLFVLAGSILQFVCIFFYIIM